MKNLYILLLISFLSFNAVAQVSSYGVVDTADLKMTTCSFEKGANAMVLFDVAEVSYKYATIIMERHKRIKIFNEKGTKEANIRIEFYGADKDEIITGIEAQTVNLVNNKVQIFPLDKKLIYEEKIDKERLAKVFSFSNVKSGSVIEFKYRFETPYPYNYPNWVFQANIPTLYSEFKANYTYEFELKIYKNITQKAVTDTLIKISEKRNKNIWALVNIPSFRIEPYMTAIEDNLQSVRFRASYWKDTWADIGQGLLNDLDYGAQLDRPLDKEEEIVSKVKKLGTEKEKVAYLFNMVKNTMTWNKVNRWYAVDGTKRAWIKRTGNSTEINLILYHLLKLCGLNPTLMTFSTRDNGRLDPDYPEYSHLNKTILQFPLDSGRYYVLDASNKYNTFDKVPLNLLGLNMLTVDQENKLFGFIKLRIGASSKQVVFVNADIKINGSLEGKTQIINTNYNKANTLERYNTSGEKRYLENLKDDNKDINITAYKMKDMDVDSLPLREDLDFKLELTGSDDKYIYFNPNLFTGIGANPFLSENRAADIDFLYLNNYTINGDYKIPAGYKVDAIPKSMLFVMPDKSISFKRTIGEMDGAVIVHYVIDFKKTFYNKDEYPELHQFFKKMYEMLNEQIVLKKE